MIDTLNLFQSSGTLLVIFNCQVPTVFAILIDVYFWKGGSGPPDLLSGPAPALQIFGLDHATVAFISNKIIFKDLRFQLAGWMDCWVANTPQGMIGYKSRVTAG